MKPIQVTGIGNALVDVLAKVEDDFLTDNAVEKGVMTLIDTDRAASLYGAMGPAQEISGGSAANTLAGLGMLGAKSAFIGKVRDDQLGAIFAHDIRSLGVGYDTPMAPKTTETETGRCIVLVTPDGERSMSTYLGVSAELGPDDIVAEEIAASEWIYLEGYRFDGAEGKAAFRKAVAAAKAAGTKVALTVSDPFCIDRHRDDFAAMIRDGVDLLFANEAEIKALYETEDLGQAMKQAQAEVELTACTVGSKGCHVVTRDDIRDVPATDMPMVDATGAGDLFAAGFLYGLVEGRDVSACGRMGCLAAGEVISHIGARPQQDLKALFRAEKLI
jgi:sugar/nucleoside kinase (ribokinase family)